MRESDPSAALPPSLWLRIENVCSRFEAAWQAGQQPRIEDDLADAPERDRPLLLRELLALELAYRCRQGDTLVLDDYRQRFPDQADVVVAVFRAAGAWAGPPAGESASSDQQVSTGPEQAGAGEGEPPARLGRYRVTAKLGSGGYGVVYRGYDDDLRRLVAIKVPRPDRVSRPEDVEAYLAEARILASLDHPHIVPVHDVGRTDDGLCYVVSKFIEGSDLRAKIKEARPSATEAAQLVAMVAEALHYAHRHGWSTGTSSRATSSLTPAASPMSATSGWRSSRQRLAPTGITPEGIRAVQRLADRLGAERLGQETSPPGLEAGRRRCYHPGGQANRSAPQEALPQSLLSRGRRHFRRPVCCGAEPFGGETV